MPGYISVNTSPRSFLYTNYMKEPVTARHAITAGSCTLHKSHFLERPESEKAEVL